MPEKPQTEDLSRRVLECVNSMDCYPDMYIMKTDSRKFGVVCIRASTANNNDWARDVIQTQDGNYVVTGTWNDDGWNSTVTLRKYDTGGDLMWFKNFNNSTANESYEIIETSEGDLVLLDTPERSTASISGL